jgi:hypothetical protein
MFDSVEEEETEAPEPPGNILASGYVPSPIGRKPEYLEGEEGQCKWCGNWGPVDRECENSPKDCSIYLLSNAIGHPPVPTVYVQIYFLNLRVLERLRQTTLETELQVFWELVQEMSFRRFMANNYGEVNPKYTTGSYVQDRIDKCKYCKLTTVPELMS